jgi:hypothetical protein
VLWRIDLEDGGHINGAFLQADLVDKVSLLLVPGIIDGRHGIPAIFDGMNPSRNVAVPLKLNWVEQRANDTLWIRYAVLNRIAQVGVSSFTLKGAKNEDAQTWKQSLGCSGARGTGMPCTKQSLAVEVVRERRLF